MIVDEEFEAFSDDEISIDVPTASLSDISAGHIDCSSVHSEMASRISLISPNSFTARDRALLSLSVTPDDDSVFLRSEKDPTSPVDFTIESTESKACLNKVVCNEKHLISQDNSSCNTNERYEHVGDKEGNLRSGMAKESPLHRSNREEMSSNCTVNVIVNSDDRRKRTFSRSKKEMIADIYSSTDNSISGELDLQSFIMKTAQVEHAHLEEEAKERQQHLVGSVDNITKGIDNKTGRSNAIVINNGHARVQKYVETTVGSDASNCETNRNCTDKDAINEQRDSGNIPTEISKSKCTSIQATQVHRLTDNECVEKHLNKGDEVISNSVQKTYKMSEHSGSVKTCEDKLKDITADRSGTNGEPQNNSLNETKENQHKMSIGNKSSSSSEENQSFKTQTKTGTGETLCESANTYTSNLEVQETSVGYDTRYPPKSTDEVNRPPKPPSNDNFDKRKQCRKLRLPSRKRRALPPSTKPTEEKRNNKLRAFIEKCSRPTSAPLILHRQKASMFKIWKQNKQNQIDLPEDETTVSKINVTKNENFKTESGVHLSSLLNNHRLKLLPATKVSSNFINLLNATREKENGFRNLRIVDIGKQNATITQLNMKEELTELIDPINRPQENAPQYLDRLETGYKGVSNYHRIDKRVSLDIKPGESQHSLPRVNGEGNRELNQSQQFEPIDRQVSNNWDNKQLSLRPNYQKNNKTNDPKLSINTWTSKTTIGTSRYGLLSEVYRKRTLFKSAAQAAIVSNSCTHPSEISGDSFLVSDTTSMNATTRKTPDFTHCHGSSAAVKGPEHTAKPDTGQRKHYLNDLGKRDLNRKKSVQNKVSALISRARDRNLIRSSGLTSTTSALQGDTPALTDTARLHKIRKLLRLPDCTSSDQSIYTEYASGT